jgi:ABC-type bacteriocin/lantibiotic exporter with double-glycine peptidase domain
MGTAAIFFILLRSWLQGEKLDLSQVYALFAAIFVLYITVNALTYLGTVAMSNFSAVL